MYNKLTIKLSESFLFGSVYTALTVSVLIFRRLIACQKGPTADHDQSTSEEAI